MVRRQRRRQPSPRCRFELIAGGRSNLTYRVDRRGRPTPSPCAARRSSHVLPTAHDMAREYRVITRPGPDRGPRARHLRAVRGRDGQRTALLRHGVRRRPHRPRRGDAAERDLDDGARRRAGESLADTLAALHAVDVDAVGLGDFAKRDGYIERQLRRWYEQFRNSPGRRTSTRPTIVAACTTCWPHEIPPQVGTSIVHGDYRLDNTVLGPDGAVRAVLDWEICTLGDPLADLGLLMVYWTEPGDEAALLGVSPTTVPGFPDRAEMRARYAAASGRDLGHLDFYVAFGYWKLACILQGVYARYVGGAAAGDRSSVDDFGHSVVRLAEMALGALGAP